MKVVKILRNIINLDEIRRVYPVTSKELKIVWKCETTEGAYTTLVFKTSAELNAAFDLIYEEMTSEG